MTHSLDADSFIQALRGASLQDVEASEYFGLTMEPTLLEQRRNYGIHVLNRIPKSKMFCVQSVKIDSLEDEFTKYKSFW